MKETTPEQNTSYIPTSWSSIGVIAADSCRCRDEALETFATDTEPDTDWSPSSAVRSIRAEMLDDGLIELTEEPSKDDGTVGGVKLVGVLVAEATEPSTGSQCKLVWVSSKSVEGASKGVGTILPP